MSLFLNSCEDEDNTAEVNNLLGTWKLTKIITPEAYDINSNGTSSLNLLDELNEIEGINCLSNETLTFGVNNTVEIATTSDFDIQIYKVGDMMAFDIDCDPFNEVYVTDWSQNGNNIIIDGDEESIVNIAGDELSFVIEDYFDILNLDTDEQLYEDATFVYTKQ
ncbi:MAG: hypothetical protein AB8B52_04500 [Winogradskyella sp.]|uniref:hypothetical protein n=1 Tax=Winogradskyella sp. TaxID=1883156 RepID=UPI00385A6488